MSENNSSDKTVESAQMHEQTAQIKWSELARFFAAGKVLVVSESLDLVKVSTSVANDEAQQVEVWIQQGDIAHVPDDLAQQWQKADTVLWAVVAAPWVLVQAPKS